MGQYECGMRREEKWWNKSIFPLIPVIEYKKKDKYNTSFISLRWLFFTFWTLDSASVEVAFTIDTHWGVGVTFLLPYLRGAVTIPCPNKLGSWWYKNTARKSENEKNQFF